MMNNIVIKVQDLSKIYKLYDNPIDRLKESLHPIRKQYHRDFYALNNLNFEIQKGETVGIIGKNGSGKSTLLKILTGVLTPTTGETTVNGRISALLELGAGFNPDMTGIENIYFNGTLSGFTREEMTAKLNEILAFADIGEFVYQPVKIYSSGMFLRLAFAVAVVVKPEILIIDEALSVGDIFFQQKCYSKIRELIDSGSTLIFVTHSMPVMQNLCNRAILLENGIVIQDGDPVDCASMYSSMEPHKRPLAGSLRASEDMTENSGADKYNAVHDILQKNILSKAKSEQGSKGLEIIAASFNSMQNGSSFDVSMYDTVTIKLLLRANSFITVPNVGFSLFDHMNNLVFSTSTLQRNINLASMKSGEQISVTYKIKFAISPGEYSFALGCGEPDPTSPSIGHTHHRLLGLGPINVHPNNNKLLPFYGIAELPVEVSI